MKIKFFFALAASFFILASCGGDKKTGNDGKESKSEGGDSSLALIQELKSTYTHDGKVIELTGKFDIRHVSIVRNNKFDLGFEVKEGSKSESISPVTVGFGKKANSLYFPDKFQSSDVEVYDKDNNKLAMNNKVKISCKIKYTNKDKKLKRPSDNTALPASSRQTLRTVEDREKERTGVDKYEGLDYSFTATEVIITKLD